MKLVKPSYYDQFHCVAGACPDSCCQEWDVQVDPLSAQRYLSLDGALGDLLRNKLHKDRNGEYVLEIADRRCPMWRQDGLCQIQYELGEDGLCQVCRDFPRLRHDYGDFVELGLELSCPEAARLIFTAPLDPSIEQSLPENIQADYDQQDMEILLRTRGHALHILETHPLAEALTLLLLYGYQAQNELDGAEPTAWKPDEELEFARQAAGDCDWAALRALYADLDILTPRWAEMLQFPAPAFPEILSRMVRCSIERYWLQAISDFDLVCRVKMIIAGTLLVGHLGGDPIRTAQLYSKEIDNSIDNLEAILDAAYTHPALTDRHLLGLLQSIGV
jgi:lysine-N-methylase